MVNLSIIELAQRVVKVNISFNQISGKSSNSPLYIVKRENSRVGWGVQKLWTSSCDVLEGK